MSQIEFTSQCGGDIGVTLQNEVICIAFIYKDGIGVISHVNVHDIRAGGPHVQYPELASALQMMLCMADNYRTQDMEAEIERQITNQKAEDAKWDEPVGGWDSYFASNKE